MEIGSKIFPVSLYIKDIIHTFVLKLYIYGNILHYKFIKWTKIYRIR